MEKLITEILCNEENRINKAFKDRNYEISNFNIDFHKSDLIELVKNGISSLCIFFQLEQNDEEYWANVQDTTDLESVCIKFIDLKSYFDNVVVEDSGSVSNFNRDLDNALDRTMSYFTNIIENLIYESFTVEDIQELIELNEMNCSM